PATSSATLSLHDALPIFLEINQRLACFVEVVSAVDGVVDRLEDRNQRRLHDPWLTHIALQHFGGNVQPASGEEAQEGVVDRRLIDRKSTRLNSSHVKISY